MGGQTVRRDRVYYKGSMPIALLDAFKDITFPAPMPNDYDVYIKVPQTGTVINNIGNKTPNGFRMNLNVSLASTVDWLAVEIVA